MPWRTRGNEPFALRGLGVLELRELRDRLAAEVVAAALADQPIAPAVKVLRLVDERLAATDGQPATVARRQQLASEAR